MRCSTPLPRMTPIIVGVNVKLVAKISNNEKGVSATVATMAESVSTPIPPPHFFNRKFQPA